MIEDLWCFLPGLVSHLVGVRRQVIWDRSGRRITSRIAQRFGSVRAEVFGQNVWEIGTNGLHEADFNIRAYLCGPSEFDRSCNGVYDERCEVTSSIGSSVQ